MKRLSKTNATLKTYMMAKLRKILKWMMYNIDHTADHVGEIVAKVVVAMVVIAHNLKVKSVVTVVVSSAKTVPNVQSKMFKL